MRFDWPTRSVAAGRQRTEVDEVDEESATPSGSDDSIAIWRRAGRSIHRRWDGLPVSLRVIAVIWIVLRLSLWLVVHRAYILYDTHEYRPTSGASELEYVSLLGNALRPWTVPLFYAVLPNDQLRVIGQVLLSTAAWLTLALAIAATIRDRYVRLAAFVAVLLFGTTSLVTSWDFALLSESVAISLTCLCTAAWLRFVQRHSPTNSVCVTITTCLLVFARPQLVPVVALLAVAVAVSARRVEHRHIRAAVAAGLSIIAVWGFVVIRNVESTSEHRPEGVGAFTQNFAFVLQGRILNNEKRMAWFRDHGMPEPQGLDYSGSITEAMQHYAADQPLAQWTKDHGMAALARYSLEHPEEFPLDFAKEFPELFVPPRNEAMYTSNVPGILPTPIDQAIAPTKDNLETIAFPTQVLLLCALFGVLAMPRRRDLNRPALKMALASCAVAIAALYLGWVVSWMEPYRHAIPFVMLLPLSILLATVVLLDARFAERDTPANDPTG